ncbi:lipoprotein [Pirellula sp. SH-Sr6A]|uniref:hypothetical protein n=1 Tax=Pirellula sp. SH-Sr6A TaxID=1632865 RepID=UPI00078DE752|nr:hypothetical protein [Pirellula sp. SH-Sr6A]AMV31454.1 lipoprotein [Pirellula sp. SH-Sr6A]
MYRIILLAVGMVASIVLLSGTPHAVADELDDAVQNVSDELLTKSPSIPSGDEGFVRILHEALEVAKREQSPHDACTQNKIAILALASLLGDDRISRTAKRERDPALQKKRETLRNRITLRGRNDLSKHFWVSAGLVAMSNETNAKGVGIAKEVMDSRPGGSGFSFADLAADLAGIRFALLATRKIEQAEELRERVLRARQSDDFCPNIEGLPEGLTAEQFQNEFGGLGGKKTRDLFLQIDDRIRECPVLRGED